MCLSDVGLSGTVSGSIQRTLSDCELNVKDVLPYDPAELARTLFEQAEDALFIFDVQSQRILDANPAAQLRTGQALAQLLVRPIASVLRAERLNEQPALDNGVREGSLLEALDALLLPGRENPIPVQVTITRLRPNVSLLTARDLRVAGRQDAPMRESERQFHGLAEIANELFWRLDPQGIWTHVNGPALRAMSGYEPEEVLGQHFAKFIAPEERERAVQAFQDGVQGKVMFDFQTTGCHKNGSRTHLSINARAIFDEAGELQAVIGTTTDITRWKAAETALFESQQRFELFMNRIPMLGFMKDGDGRMIYLNRAFADKFEKPAEFFLGKLDHELWPAEIAARLRAVDLRVISGAVPREMREQVPTPDGLLREWWVVKFPFRDAQGRTLLGGIAVDLTERQQLEEALRRSEERYRQLWQRNLAGGFRAALDGRILDCNDSFARLYGFQSRADMLTRSTTELYFDLAVRREFLTRVRERQIVTNYEMQMRRADGTPIWILENVSLVQEKGEEILEGTIIDISERKRAEEALRLSESNYRTLINNLDQGIFLKDRELRYVTVNAVFCKAVGKHETELRGKTIAEVFPPHPLVEKSAGIERQVIEYDRPVETEDHVRIRGEPRVIRIHRTPVKDAAGTVVGVLGICWDVTDQRELETQLRHVQKMDAIGQLAGGIAHDFNNLLTIMLGNLSFILSGELDQRATIEQVRNVEKAALRAADLTHTVLGLSHRGALATVPCNMNESIDEVVRLTRSTLPNSIRLEVRAEANLGFVQADPTHLSQVLTNLTLNARDAMPRGGVILFQTSHFTPSADYLASHLEARPGNFVRLCVTDTGEGIPDELRQRIFEPFFTTKEKGKGTGLGLATVFSIVKQHRGWIVCESALGQGTSFDIFLPRCPGTVAPSTPVPAAALPNGVRETILLVDDESMIRQLTRTILIKAGYDVLMAEDGAQGLEVYQAHRGRIALVILDAVMPRLSGRDMLRELVRIAPDVSILFSSGFSTEQLALNEFPQVRGLLPKPYRAEQLVQKVAEVLGQQMIGTH